VSSFSSYANCSFALATAEEAAGFFWAAGLSTLTFKTNFLELLVVVFAGSFLAAGGLTSFLGSGIP
jgi:hypothetical protein